MLTITKQCQDETVEFAGIAGNQKSLTFMEVAQIREFYESRDAYAAIYVQRSLPYHYSQCWAKSF